MIDVKQIAGLSGAIGVGIALFKSLDSALDQYSNEAKKKRQMNRAVRLLNFITKLSCTARPSGDVSNLLLVLNGELDSTLQEIGELYKGKKLYRPNLIARYVAQVLFYCFVAMFLTSALLYLFNWSDWNTYAGAKKWLVALTLLSIFAFCAVACRGFVNASGRATKHAAFVNSRFDLKSLFYTTKATNLRVAVAICVEWVLVGWLLIVLFNADGIIEKDNSTLSNYWASALQHPASLFVFAIGVVCPALFAIRWVGLEDAVAVELNDRPDHNQEPCPNQSTVVWDSNSQL